MTTRRICQYPEKVLLTKAKEADLNQQNLEEIVADMIETMYAAGGVGLAAPQIGLPLRIFVMDTLWHRTGEKKPQVFINPSYEPIGTNIVRESEGCLSLPGPSEFVSRWEKVQVKGYDLTGLLVEQEVEGLGAACVQHECDHLDGKLYISHLSTTKRQRVIRKFRKPPAQ